VRVSFWTVRAFRVRASQGAPLAAAAPGSNVITNNNPGATAEYWTKAKAQSAKELVPTHTDAGSASDGSSGPDFTRSRITPQSANWISTGGSLPNRTDFATLVFNEQAFSGTGSRPVTAVATSTNTVRT
jgi:hypothetical protein